MEVVMKAGTRVGAVLTCALATTVIAALPAGASSAPASKSGCGLTQAEQGDALGSSYTYSLSARNVSCGKAKKLLIKVNDCRHEHGGRNGSCPGVKGYTCRQKAGDSTPDIYQAKVKCTKGSKKFVAYIGELT
jgi:hypothetical protein